MAWFTEFRVDDETEPHMICFFSTLNYRLSDKSWEAIDRAIVGLRRYRTLDRGVYI